MFGYHSFQRCKWRFPYISAGGFVSAVGAYAGGASAGCTGAGGGGDASVFWESACAGGFVSAGGGYAGGESARCASDVASASAGTFFFGISTSESGDVNLENQIVAMVQVFLANSECYLKW